MDKKLQYTSLFSFYFHLIYIQIEQEQLCWCEVKNEQNQTITYFPGIIIDKIDFNQFKCLISIDNDIYEKSSQQIKKLFSNQYQRAKVVDKNKISQKSDSQYRQQAEFIADFTYLHNRDNVEIDYNIFKYQQIQQASLIQQFGEQPNLPFIKKKD
ncbi:hypothetical protein PPERSA_08534 [Pseudocohnilembus persalinus]|uniref:Uncharacterized protein n=1 Tax=Pseudocohnilembus persalinus TaxID=266149 RepID=A0A0V0R6N4_PSEPJ|nr:hypothetical protein PPERSA_08534 [Pseudocohnilembus persalinus]|eukprot:KRX10131.1 hypothetical protein PPERSA_08534 [Pseudocohnilembus persalinus]